MSAAFELTEAQRLAVESRREGGICVLAGPGSGKTRVLVERIRRLIEVDGVPGEQILAITFTRKAANSMYQRLAREAPPDSPVRKEIEKAQISTIDAFCARFLREHALDAGIAPDFRVLDPAEAEFELRRVVTDTLESIYQEDPEAARSFLRVLKGAEGLVDELDGTKLHQQVRMLVDRVRTWGEEGLDAPIEDEPGLVERAWITAVMRRVIESYRGALGSRDALDFTETALEALRLLERGVRPRTELRHVLLDENQDTNPIQDRLVRLLADPPQGAQPHVFAVGDANQSIYSFRNADPDVFAEFRRRVEADGGDVVELKENFRSRQQILDLVEAMLGQATGIEPMKLVAARELPAADEPCVEAMIICGDNARRREADWIAHRIRELGGKLRLGSDRRAPRWKDFAVLLRTNALLTDFADGLRRAGIPYQLNAGRGFFETEEVRDALRLLWTIENPRDEISLAAVLRSPLVGLGDASLLRLKRQQFNLYDHLRQAPALGLDEDLRLKAFLKGLERWREQRVDSSISLLLSRVAAETGYEAWLLARESGLQRVANLEKLGRLADRTAGEGVRGFGETLRRLEDIRLGGSLEAEATVPEDAADAVHLMTVHMAKGLEFPVVILPSINSGPRGESDPLLYSRERGLAVRRVDPVTVEETKDPCYEAVKRECKDRERAEDSRVFYVGLTRAEEYLLVSASFNGKPRRDSWAKYLIGTKNDRSGLDLSKQIDDEGKIETAKGCRLRVLRTDRDPPPLEAEAEGLTVRAVDLIEPLAASGAEDSEAAVTAVSVFAQCPRRYYLERYLGLESVGPARPQGRVRQDEDVVVERDEKDPTELGREVHELLAGALSPEDCGEEAQMLAQVFQRSELGRRTDTATRSFRERNLLFPVGGRLLRGQIDLWFADEQGSVLLDYKTDQVDPTSTASKAATYAVQLQLYARALELSGEGRPDCAVLFFLRTGEALEVDLSDEALGQAEQRAIELFEAQARLDFPIRAGDHCWSCPYRGRPCPVKLPAEQMSLL